MFINSQSVTTEIMRQQSVSRDIAKLQTQISSGAKFDAPSDNPQDWIQISAIGRQQSLATAWKSNLDFATSRAAQASSSLDDVNNLMTRVTELLVKSTSTSADSPGAEAVAQELQGIKDQVSSILNQKDYQGTPTFDDTSSVNIPVGQGLSVQAVGTRQSIENGVPTSGGPKTIYDVLDAAIAAVKSGDKAAQSVSLTDTRTALDHVITAQSQQGVRAQRLDDETQRLTNTNLNLTERRSNLEDTDLSTVVSQLQAKLLTLQAAQTAFAKINQQSLFSLIQ